VSRRVTLRLQNLAIRDGSWRINASVVNRISGGGGGGWTVRLGGMREDPGDREVEGLEKKKHEGQNNTYIEGERERER
jgi:hypothetical protein